MSIPDKVNQLSKGFMLSVNFKFINVSFLMPLATSGNLKLSLEVTAGDTIEISAQAFYNIDNQLPGKSVNIAPVTDAAPAAIQFG